MEFENVITLKPGYKHLIDTLTIEATSGAPVPNIENGYIISNTSESLYIEPHGFLDKNINSRNIDTIITPVVDISLPIAGKFIKGKTILPELINLFKPSTILSSTNGGEINFTGILTKFINVEGSNENIKEIIDSKIKFINPTPYVKYKIKN